MSLEMLRLFSPGVSFHHDHPNVTRVVGCFGHTYPHYRCFLKPRTPTQATGALPYALENWQLAGTLDTSNAFALPLLFLLIETNKVATDFPVMEETGRRSMLFRHCTEKACLPSLRRMNFDRPLALNPLRRKARLRTS